MCSLLLALFSPGTQFRQPRRVDQDPLGGTEGVPGCLDGHRLDRTDSPSSHPQTYEVPRGSGRNLPGSSRDSESLAFDCRRPRTPPEGHSVSVSGLRAGVRATRGATRSNSFANPEMWMSQKPKTFSLPKSSGRDTRRFHRGLTSTTGKKCSESRPPVQGRTETQRVLLTAGSLGPLPSLVGGSMTTDL